MVTVAWLDPPPLTLIDAGARLTPGPPGDTAAPSETVPLKPFNAAPDTVKVVLSPARIVRALGVTESWKSGAAVWVTVNASPEMLTFPVRPLVGLGLAATVYGTVPLPTACVPAG